MWGLVALAGLAVVAIVVSAGVALYQRWQRRSRLRVAKALFHRRREWLEAQFMSRASTHGKPRSLVWADCEFEDAIALARDRNSGQLRALIGVTITFSSDGQPTEDTEETSPQEATAVFRFDGAEWTTDGRAIFNLNPAETIRRYGHELEFVE
jgi:hypothetical protein